MMDMDDIQGASPPAETGEGSLEEVAASTGRMTVVSMLAAVSNAIACIRASKFSRGARHERESDKRADELNRARNRLIEALNSPSDQSDTERMRADAERYRFLRSRDPGPHGEPVPTGVFIGTVPANLILTEGDADAAVDAARAALAEKEADQ